MSLISTTDAVASYSATRLFSGTGYKFGIVAIDAANNRSPMRTVTFTTAASSDTTAPSAPSSSSVSGTAFSASRLDLVWGASSSSDVAAYQVFRNGALVGTVELPSGLRFSNNGLVASTSYTYVVKAVDSAGNVSAGTTGRILKTPAAGTLRIARGPYVSNVTGTSAVISWWTNLPTPGAVSWGVASATERTQSDPAGTVQHHQVTIGGLTPGTTYLYQVGNNAGLVSTGGFASAAPRGQAFKFAAIGDFGGGSVGEAQNASNIAGAGTSFIQTLGDNIYPSAGNPDPSFSTTYSDFDARFYKQFGAALKTQAFFPANGNKEYYGDGVFWQNFPMPGSNHSWYSYDWGDAHIVVLDTEQPIATGSPQFNFAQGDLAAHQSDAWRIVVLQRPPYSSGTANASSKPVQQYLVPLFQQQKVNLVLSGNSHNYERTHPLINGAPAAGGITYVVSGAGGNGFNAFSLAAPAYSAFREASYYEYLRVAVSPTTIQLDGIRADTNAVFDSATITKSTGSPVPPPTGLRATAVGSTEIDLSWTASNPATGVTGYRVRRNAGTPVTVAAPATSFKDTGLTASTAYSYSVTAVDANGAESTAATASATTGAVSGGTTVTLSPTADAMIDATNHTQNFGSSTRLAVDNSPVQNVLFKFTVPSTCASPISAKLAITVGSATNDNSPAGGSFYNAPDNGWNENTVTWDTAPATTGSPVASLGAVALGTSYTVDVKPLVSGPGVVSIRASSTSGDAARYVSKEDAAAGAKPPQLALTC